MSISARTILVGQLSDGRLQVWVQQASSDAGGFWAGAVFSRWKISTDPNSPWTDWQPLDATYNGQQIALLATSIYPTLQSQLFGVTGEGVLVWTLKASEDVNSDWLPWTPFNNPPPGGYLTSLQNFTAACLGTSSSAYTAGVPIVLWSSSTSAGTYWIQTTRNVSPPVGYLYENWNSLGSYRFVWPVYVGGIFGPSPITGFSVWARLVTDNWDELVWSTITLIPKPGSGPPNNLEWSDFQPFMPQLPGWQPGLPYYDPAAVVVDCFAAGVLPDGRMQLFATDTNGGVWTIWQIDVRGNWLPQWLPFPQPGGRPPFVVTTPYPYGYQNSFYNPPMSLTVSSLYDGRLQLFAIDNTFSVWTTWKTTTDPNSDWSSWEQF